MSSQGGEPENGLKLDRILAVVEGIGSAVKANEQALTALIEALRSKAGIIGILNTHSAMLQQLLEALGGAGEGDDLAEALERLASQLELQTALLQRIEERLDLIGIDKPDADDQ